MNDVGAAVQLVQQAFFVGFKICFPVLAFGLATGIAVGIFQTVTQLQDATLSFIPKLLATLLSLVLFGPWMINTLVRYIADIFNLIPHVIG